MLTEDAPDTSPDPAVGGTATTSPATNVVTLASTTTTMVPTTTVVSATTASPSSCSTEPTPPPALINGSSAGAATYGQTDVGTVLVAWGEGELRVGQMMGYRLAGGTISAAEQWGEVRQVGRFLFAVVEVGDFDSQIAIEIRDSTSGCYLNYWVGPGVGLDAAWVFAERIVRSL